ncbi:MAG: hypothetical protein CBD97_02155 [Pelagibacteraceae bacterium TMED237]|nr:MAG: hypothetical protein CBD97_02155 [Pelagibacteraceae bacterium TMED237]|tara:strand:+ start:1414 stop:2367 length:954 start_codon:yes stop_codon:yes gene_type:complete
MVQNSNNELNFPKFEDISVSTKTFTANTNLKIDIKNVFDKLEVTPYTVIQKKRGRKKRTETINPNQNIVPGSIITVKCEGEIKGVDLKPKKKNNKKKKWFRNSITVVIIFDKIINFKICRNGTFQMTGCKNHNHAELCIKKIWEEIKNFPEHLYEFTRPSLNGDNKLEVLFIPSMRNIDFSLGFIVDREKLNKYMTDKAMNSDDFHCLLETSFGYTGVNIKIPLTKDIRTMKIRKMSYEKDGSWLYTNTNYNEYLNLLPSEKDKNNKLNDERYNTFLVFHSGKVIHSGLTFEFMQDSYYFFLDVMREGFNYIEERLD